jgi:hypothetical protein
MEESLWNRLFLSEVGAVLKSPVVNRVGTNSKSSLQSPLLALRWELSCLPTATTTLALESPDLQQTGADKSSVNIRESSGTRTAPVPGQTTLEASLYKHCLDNKLRIIDQHFRATWLSMTRGMHLKQSVFWKQLVDGTMTSSHDCSLTPNTFHCNQLLQQCLGGHLAQVQSTANQTLRQRLCLGGHLSQHQSSATPTLHSTVLGRAQSAALINCTPPTVLGRAPATTSTNYRQTHRRLGGHHPSALDRCWEAPVQR